MSETEIKVILVGNSNVGKTCIATRYAKGAFPDGIEPTVGAAVLSKEVEIIGMKCTFNIWDTAGQEAYRYLVPMYYRNAQIAVVVFDLTNESSFQAVPEWINDVKKSVGDDIVVLICGNKSDCENKAVDFETIQDFISQTRYMYVEVSALTGANLDKVFEMGFLELQKIVTKKTNNDTSTVDINEEKEKKGGCC